MAIIILSQKFVHENQDFEIFVRYDKDLQRVTEVKNIQFHTHGAWYPIGGILTKFFHDAVWKLINETDWVSICKEFCDPAPKGIHPIMHQALRSITMHLTY